MYQVIARRWRPRTFSEVVGQRHVVETLRRAIEKGKILHSYLFAGPRGVGKTSMARIFAKALNCEKGPTPDPCCKCEACLSIERGTFVDVVEMDAASNRGIDEIRELRERIRYASVKGRYKVYIVDEVHMLTDAAFNALLKTLEEPPPGVVFIFATTEPQKIPQTILSRCVRFDFKPLTMDEAVRVLERICRQEGVSYQVSALEVIAEASGGSLRDAEMLLEQAMLFTDGNLTRDSVFEVLGLVDTLVAERFIQALLNRDVDQALSIFKKEVVGRGYDVSGFLSTLLKVLRERLEKSAVSGKLEDTVRFYTFMRTFLRLAEEIRRHPFPELVAEAEVIRLASLPPLEDIAGLLEGIEKDVSEIKGSEQSFAEGSQDQKKWFVDLVSRKNPVVAGCLEGADVSVRGKVIVVEPGSLGDVGWDRIRREEALLKEVASSAGYDIEIRGEPKKNNNSLTKDKVRKMARENPIVRTLFEVFPEAVIVDVEKR